MGCGLVSSTEPKSKDRCLFPWTSGNGNPLSSDIVAEASDPFDDFDEDDFDDDFDDDFEEDWEDDLTEDEEFPDTFGGQDDEDEDDKKDSPFSDDPDFDK